MGLSAFAAGVRTLPMAVLAAVCAPLSGRLVAATGARLPLVVSGLATAAGAALLVPIDEGTSARTCSWRTPSSASASGW